MHSRCEHVPSELDVSEEETHKSNFLGSHLFTVAFASSAVILGSNWDCPSRHSRAALEGCHPRHCGGDGPAELFSDICASSAGPGRTQTRFLNPAATPFSSRVLKIKAQQQQENTYIMLEAFITLWNLMSHKQHLMHFPQSLKLLNWSVLCKERNQRALTQHALTHPLFPCEEDTSVHIRYSR